MRVAITGGCGFVGSRLAFLLVSAGHEVLIIDDMSVGKVTNLSRAVRDAATIEQLDVRDAEAVARSLQSFRPSTVYHLAAMHFIPTCNAQPRTCIDINVVGTRAVLDACSSASTVQAVVVASSAAIYEPSAKAHEEHSSRGPTDIYGFTKLWTEDLTKLFHEQTNIGVGIARLFNVFGPGETNPHLIPTIIHQLRQGGGLHLGNLSTKRDYVFVEDVAAALMALSDACQPERMLVCNVGSEKQVDGFALIQLFERMLDRRFEVLVDPSRLRPSDRPFLLSDCRHTHEVLDWYAATDLELGLRLTLEESVLRRN